MARPAHDQGPQALRPLPHPADAILPVPDEAVALAGRIPGVRAAHDVAQVPGRGLWKLVTWQPLDRLGFHRRTRSSYTLLEFGNTVAFSQSAR